MVSSLSPGAPVPFFVLYVMIVYFSPNLVMNTMHFFPASVPRSLTPESSSRTRRALDSAGKEEIFFS